MNVGVGIFEFVVLFVFTALLLRYYAARGIHVAYLAAVFVSWYLGFFGTLLLPVDVEETIEREPLGAFETLWMLVYWTTFILSWIVLPILMEFYASGAFTFKDRMKDSLKSNLKFYAAILLLSTVIIVWMAISNSWGPSALSGFLMAAANTYGMLLIVVMMGYGLVEMPREIWIYTFPERALRRLEYKAAEVEEQLFDATQNLNECIAEAMQLDSKVPANRVNAEDVELRRCMDMIMSIVPEANSADVAALRASGALTDDAASFKVLGRVHTKLRKAIPQFEKWNARKAATLREAAELQAIIDHTEQPMEYDSEHPEGRLAACWRRARWTYRSRMNWWMGKGIAAALAAMSALVLWCELAIPLPWDLSMFGLMIGGAKGSFSQQFLCFVPFAYMSWCMYLALFKVKLLGAISLTPNRLTNAYNLMFNASYLCRLQFVVAFNYLLVIKTDALSGHSTAFENVLGSHMETVPLFGTDFNNWIPILLLVFAAMTLFRVVDRVVRIIGIEGFAEYVPGREEDEERRTEGKEFIRSSQDEVFRRKGASSARRGGTISAAKLQRGREMAAAIRGQTYTPPPHKPQQDDSLDDDFWGNRA